MKGDRQRNLLKGKKHEWVVIAFVRDNKVMCFYANKGDDNKSVSFNINVEEIISICKANNYQTVMRFHNHPNSNPNNYNCLVASEQDKYSANALSRVFIEHGISWLDFVCERGRFLEFYRKFSNDFFPLDSSFLYISEQNQNPDLYYKLHRELGIIRYYGFLNYWT